LKVAVTASVIVVGTGAASGAGYAVDLSVSNAPSASASAPKDPPGVKQSSAEITVADAKNAIKNAEASLFIHWSKLTGAMAVDNKCASHSYNGTQKYGVQDFFNEHPCKWVFRAYLAAFSSTSANGPGLLIALSWVDMPNVSVAKNYKQLVDKYTTGNVTELSRDMGPYQNIPYSGKHYASGIDNTAVWNVQVQPVTPVPTSVINDALREAHP
jgi:hypothetical protein